MTAPVCGGSSDLATNPKPDAKECQMIDLVMIVLTAAHLCVAIYAAWKG